MRPLALNGVTLCGIPVVIEHPDDYPFDPGERERDWHEASDEEYATYVNYWNSKEE